MLLLKKTAIHGIIKENNVRERDINMKNNNKKNIVLRICAIVLAICLISSFFISVDFLAGKTDLVLYRISGIMLFSTIEIGVLLEMNLFNLRKRVPLINGTNKVKHILFGIIVFMVAIILFLIPYNMTSGDFRSQLNKRKDTFEVNKDAKDTDIPEAAFKKTKKDNQQMYVTEINEQAVIDEPENTIEPNIDVSQEVLTWGQLSQKTDRYKLVMTLLGENFNTRIFVASSFSELSLEEQHLVKELFDYANRSNTLPTDFTETFTAFCVGEEFENMFFDGIANNAFYNSLSKSFVISWKSDGTYYINIREITEEIPTEVEEFVVEELPFTYFFDETEHVVGDCSVVLKKIEIVNTPFKAYAGSASYAKHIRIQATVKNNSSQETYITSRQSGSYFIGKYYGTTTETKIGWNDNYKWKVDADIKSDIGWNLKPDQSRDICVTGVFIDDDRLKYSDAPKIDLYFVNGEDTLTITIN